MISSLKRYSFSSLLLLFFMLFNFAGFAQTLPGTYSSSWIGNTFGKGGKPESLNSAWMQDYVDQMVVQPDGTIYTTSIWDEAHREYGVYKDGKVYGNVNHKINNQEIIIDGKRWYIDGNLIKGPHTITDAGIPKGLAKTPDNKLLVADDGPRKQILFYNVKSTPKLVETFGVKGGIGAAFTAGYPLPAATNTHAFAAGKYPPGFYHPFKLWDLTGVGMDDKGRLYVSTSEGATSIRCFKKDRKNRWILDFILENYIFVDNVDYDPTTDAIDLYGVQEHFVMDYSKTTPGGQWRLKGYTADHLKYPNDPRNILDVKAGHEHGLTSARIRYINGKRFLYTQGMTCQMLNIFRFEDNSEIAAPAGLIMETNHRMYDHPLTYPWPPNRPTIEPGTMIWRDLNGDGDYQANEYSKSIISYSPNFWIDRKGGIWEAANPIKVRNCAGLDSKGNPIYDDANIDSHQISGIEKIGKVIYQEDKDRVILLDNSCRDLKGSKVYAVDNWSKGNRNARFISELKSLNPSSIIAEDNYIFEAGFETRAEVFVTDITTGKRLGSMLPSDELGGVKWTGWVDIGWGVNAYKRKNGEFLVFVEDDFLSRVILYKWCPTGTCGGS